MNLKGWCMKSRVCLNWYEVLLVEECNVKFDEV